MRKFVIAILVGVALGFVIAQLYKITNNGRSDRKVVQDVQQSDVSVSDVEKKIALVKKKSRFGSITIKYGQYDGRPVELTLDDHGGVTIGILSDTANVYNDGYLNYLQEQVEMAFALKSGLTLPDGTTLRIEGFPVWGPHRGYGPEERPSVNLFFGRRFEIIDRTVVVYGEKVKPQGFYPYRF